MKKLSLFLSLFALLFAPMTIGCGSDTGTVKLTLQDAPGNLEKLEVTIKEVSIHFVPEGKKEEAKDDDPAVGNDDPQKAGWRSILDKETTFDLIKLKDKPTELGLINLAPGKITQIRLYLAEDKKVTATIDGKEHDVTVPSGKVKLTKGFTIKAGEETLIKLDFDAAASLKEQGKGQYKLQPTIKILD